MTELLLQHGADVEICDKDGRTPLHKAVMCANTEAARRLLRCGVPLDHKDDMGRWVAVVVVVVVVVVVFVVVVVVVVRFILTVITWRLE